MIELELLNMAEQVFKTPKKPPVVPENPLDIQEKQLKDALSWLNKHQLPINQENLTLALKQTAQKYLAHLEHEEAQLFPPSDRQVKTQRLKDLAFLTGAGALTGGIVDQIQPKIFPYGSLVGASLGLMAGYAAQTTSKDALMEEYYNRKQSFTNRRQAIKS